MRIIPRSPFGVSAKHDHMVVRALLLQPYILTQKPLIMRQITYDAIRAFENGYNFKRGNTRVIVGHDGVEYSVRLLLHGNLIAERTSNGVYIQDGGWQSNTTKERLNGLSGVNIVQRNWVWYLNGEAWNGGFIRVN